jgi:hypothetical protein
MVKTYGEILEPVVQRIETDFPVEERNDLKIIAYMAALTTNIEAKVAGVQEVTDQ